MRRIAKRWPPSNVSPDDQPPRSLRQAEKEHQAALSTIPQGKEQTRNARASFDALDKKKLREALLLEQGGLCVYCQQPLTDQGRRDSVPHVEHWRSLRDNPDQALHWNNLYLSCPTPTTCDGAKGKRRLAWSETDPELPWPTEVPYHDWIGFTSGGEAYVRTDARLDTATRRTLTLALNDCLESGQTRLSLLNLNARALVEARKAAIDSERKRLERDFPKSTVPMEERRARAKALLKKSSPLPSFISVRIAWLTRQTGKNKGPA